MSGAVLSAHLLKSWEEDLIQMQEEEEEKRDGRFTPLMVIWFLDDVRLLNLYLDAE